MRKIDATVPRPSDPIKWKKHLTLVNWKLREREHLLRSINRYRIEDLEDCLGDIKKELARESDECVFVIKLVYKDNYLKLPNIVISTGDDLENARDLLAVTNISKFDEIWYCKNRNKSDNAVFGRMLFGNNDLFPTRCPIRYEMVWGSSARIIEKYPLISNTFISYDSDSWNTPLVVDCLNCGERYEDEVLATSKKIIDRISKYTLEIIDFASFVFSCGCSNLCLEFSFVDDDFSFIDWDSDDDMKAIRANNTEV